MPAMTDLDRLPHIGIHTLHRQTVGRLVSHNPMLVLSMSDVAVISHNHYDHLDSRSVSALLSKVAVWAVPLRVKEWFVTKGVNPDCIVELDWWQSWHRVHPRKGQVDCKLVCTPCQHASGRTLTDRDRTLWCM